MTKFNNPTNYESNRITNIRSRSRKFVNSYTGFGKKVEINERSKNNQLTKKVESSLKKLIDN